MSNNNYLDLGNQDVKITICKYAERLQKLHCVSTETETCDLLISLMKELTPSR